MGKYDFLQARHIMSQSPTLQQIEEILDYRPIKELNIRTYYESQKNFPDSYREVMPIEEEMVRDWHGGTVFRGDENEILGINLYACEINPERLQKLLELPFPHLQALNLNQTGLTAFAFTDKHPAISYM